MFFIGLPSRSNAVLGMIFRHDIDKKLILVPYAEDLIYFCSDYGKK